MHRAAAIVILTCSLSGCWTLEPQRVALTEAQTAALEEMYGADLEAMEEAIERMLRADVVDVVKAESGRLEAVLSPPIEEALAKGAGSFIERASGMSGPDLIAGAILAALGVGGTLRWRKQYKKPPNA
jgi:hypothetical protein